MQRLKIEFIGVGEAFDPALGNSSVLVHSSAPGGDRTRLLVDCGYAVPRSFFGRYPDPELLDGVYFTHFHADHAFGFPALIGRLRGDKRTRPLTVIGQPGTKGRLTEIYELAYPGSMAKTPFELEFIEFEPARPQISWRGLDLSFAELMHPMKNFGIRIETDGRSAGISGDGSMTEQSRSLFSGVDLLVHEAFQFEKTGDPVFDVGHCNAREVAEFAAASPAIGRVALVHIRRLERQRCCRELNELAAIGVAGRPGPLDILIPEPGDCVLA